MMTHLRLGLFGISLGCRGGPDTRYWIWQPSCL